MKGKKSVIGLITAIVLVLLISGCGGRGDSVGIEQKEIYIGTGAVDIRFVPETLPNFDVPIPYTLSLSAELVNKGAHPTTGTVILEGITGVPSQQFNADGRTSYQEQGNPLRLDFTSVINSGKQILLTACYPYKTWLKGDICYDPEMTPSTLQKACTFKQYHSFSDGQGAPVVITDLEIRRIGAGGGADTADIVFKIKNLGNGQVRSLDAALYDCTAGQTVGYEHRDKVKVTKVMFNGQNLQCQPMDTSGIATLYNGEAILTCKATGLTGMGTAEKKPFEVTLDYGYVTQSGIKTINIQKTFT